MSKSATIFLTKCLSVVIILLKLVLIFYVAHSCTYMHVHLDYKLVIITIGNVLFICVKYIFLLNIIITGLPSVGAGAEVYNQALRHWQWLVEHRSLRHPHFTRVWWQLCLNR